MIKFWLLTHARELQKDSNTGQLVVEALTGNKESSAKVVKWERVEPDAQLIYCIDSEDVLLLYPSDDAIIKKVNSSSTTNLEDQRIGIDHFKHIIIIDGTWQEARKIFNKSEYLKKVPKLHLVTTTKSRYHLRRNQKNHGLCTAEIIIEMLKFIGCTNSAIAVDNVYSKFLLDKSI